MKSLSLIIPVYNGEQYIENCYNTISKQTINNFEIIFINDGSTDSTFQILEKLATLDTRITLFHQKNKGVSAARNKGLEIATNEYIIFVDVDDIIKVDFCQTLLNNIEVDEDILITNIIFERDNQYIIKSTSFEYNKIYKKEEINNLILKRLLCLEDLTLIPVYNKIYKKEFLIRKKIKFIEGLSLEEDGVFNAMVFHHLDKIRFIDYAGYIYKENENSVTRDFIKNKIFEKNLIKYNFEYKKYVKLIFSDSDISKFKSSRLIYSVSFLIFCMMKNKRAKSSEKVNYIYSILTNLDVITANRNLHEIYLDKQTIFEKYISYSINHPNKTILTLNISIFNLLNNKTIISFLRIINK